MGDIFMDFQLNEHVSVASLAYAESLKTSLVSVKLSLIHKEAAFVT